MLGAERTPHVFVLDGEQRLAYRGAPDADHRIRPRTPLAAGRWSGPRARPGRDPSRGCSVKGGAITAPRRGADVARLEARAREHRQPRVLGESLGPVAHAHRERRAARVVDQLLVGAGVAEPGGAHRRPRWPSRASPRGARHARLHGVAVRPAVDDAPHRVGGLLGRLGLRARRSISSTSAISRRSIFCSAVPSPSAGNGDAAQMLVPGALDHRETVAEGDRVGHGARESRIRPSEGALRCLLREHVVPSARVPAAVPRRGDVVDRARGLRDGRHGGDPVAHRPGDRRRHARAARRSGAARGRDAGRRAACGSCSPCSGGSSPDACRSPSRSTCAT